jgi:large repetitive protein
LLPSGRVLVAGGDGDSGYLSSAELYDPATGTWTATTAMLTGRYYHTATLLAGGQVLLVAGYNDSYLASGELYDAAVVFNYSWQPHISSVSSPLELGGSLTLGGDHFRGISEGTSGNTQSSPANYPVVQLHSVEGGQSLFLPATNWSANSFSSAPVWGFPPGYALATMFVNGIPSTSSVVSVSVPVPTPPRPTYARRLGNGGFEFGFTNSVGAWFGVLANTNVTQPLANWAVLGGVTEIAPGRFQFTDWQATNYPRRFYRVRSP